MTVPDDLTEWRKEIEDERTMAGSAWADVHPAYRERSDRFLALIDALIAARKVIRAVEWSSRGAEEICVYCRFQRHHPDCALAAVLRGET